VVLLLAILLVASFLTTSAVKPPVVAMLPAISAADARQKEHMKTSSVTRPVTRQS
jgi:hypothetical protein